MENAHYGAKENDKKKSGSIHWNAAAFFCRVIRGRMRREAGEGMDSLRRYNAAFLYLWLKSHFRG